MPLIRCLPPRYNGKYKCLVADPPWEFKDSGTRLSPDYEGVKKASGMVYPTMKFADIMAMNRWINFLMARDSFLFLWAPDSFVLDGQATALARAWGFEPKQKWVWIKLDKSGKPRFGGGHYARLCTENLLLCRRGKAKVKVHNETNVIEEFLDEDAIAEDLFITGIRGEHSAKPDESYQKIERLVDGPYLEMFARRQWNADWNTWGNELLTAA